MQDILGTSKQGLDAILHQSSQNHERPPLEGVDIRITFSQNTDRVIDAGGPFRTWLVLVAEQLFSHKAGLFLPSKLGSNPALLQINPRPGRGCEIECIARDLRDGLLTPAGAETWYRFAGQILGLTLRAVPTCCLGEWANFVPSVYKLLLNQEPEFEDLQYLHKSLHDLMCQCRRRILAHPPAEVAWPSASNDGDAACASGGGGGSGAQARRHVRLVTKEPHHLDCGQHFVAPLGILGSSDGGGDGGGFDSSGGVMRLQVVFVENKRAVIAEVVSAGCVAETTPQADAAVATAPKSLRLLSNKSVVRKLAEHSPAAADPAAAAAHPATALPLSFDSFTTREDFVSDCLVTMYEEVYQYEIAADTTPEAVTAAQKRKRKRCAAAYAAVGVSQEASGAPEGGGSGGGPNPCGLPLPVRNGSDLPSTRRHAQCGVTAENVDEWVDETSDKMLSGDVCLYSTAIRLGIEDVLRLDEWVAASKAADVAAASRASRAVVDAHALADHPVDASPCADEEGTGEGGLAHAAAGAEAAEGAAEKAWRLALAAEAAAKEAAAQPAWERLRRALTGLLPAASGGVDVEEWRRRTFYLPAGSEESKQVEWFWNLVSNHAHADAIAAGPAGAVAAEAGVAAAAAAGMAPGTGSAVESTPAAGGVGGAAWGYTGSGRRRSFQEALLEFITALPALPAEGPALGPGGSRAPAMTIHLTDLPGRPGASKSVSDSGGGGRGEDTEPYSVSEEGGYPSASTCSQTLYLPRYRSEATLRERLVVAVLEWMRAGRGNYTRA